MDYEGKNALAVARGLLSPYPVPRIIGYAVCNALSQKLAREGAISVDTETILMDLVDPRPGDHVGIVGFTPSLVRHLAGGADEVTVLERGPRTSRRPNVQVTTDPRRLAACNKVLITSTTILNGTFDEIEAITRKAVFRAIYGPGAGILPTAFFARGFHVVAGMLVLDAALLAERHAAGKRWGSAKQKCLFIAP